MTDSNFNLTSKEVEHIMDNLTYTLDSEKYKQLEKFPVLYDSLMNLLSALAASDSSNTELANVVAILDYFNNSFLQFLETIDFNQNLEKREP